MRIRHAVVLAALCGCDMPRPVLRVDAAVDAAHVEIDAAPTWKVIETLDIDSAKPQGATSLAVLAAGTMYKLRASGTAIVTDTIPGDADYYDFAIPKDNGCCEDFGIGIDDSIVDLTTTPDWGAYNPTHVYEIMFMGKGAVIRAAYQDTVYSNNSGTLVLEIMALR